jgi:hypothetical protein
MTKSGLPMRKVNNAADFGAKRFEKTKELLCPLF